MTTTTNIPIFYLLDDEGRRKALLQGLPPTELQRLEVPATAELVPLTRVPPDGNASAHIGYVPHRDSDKPTIYDNERLVLGWTVRGYGEPVAVPHREHHRFEEPQSVESLLAWEAARAVRVEKEEADAVEQAEEKFEVYRAEESARKQREQEEAEKRAADARERQAEERRALAKRFEEASRWAREHDGSSRLRKMVDAGLHLQAVSLYEDERLASERPGWVSGDTRCARETARWPSEEALDKLLAARQLDPEVALRWCPGERRLVMIGRFLEREIYHWLSEAEPEDE